MRFRQIELFFLLLLASVCAHAQTVRVMVQRSPLAGFQYHAGATVWEEMKVGDTLSLSREPDNRHDRNAVCVSWRGQQLGYLPRAANSAVAAEMDRGGRIDARIARLTSHRNPWQRVLIDVYAVL